MTSESDGSRQKRPGRTLHVQELNVDKGSERFPIRGDLFPPETASWRNNLIALSQRRNLLFTACRHQIYVWEPAGSSQALGTEPEMIITPIMKNPRAGGYISPQIPHAVNNILVDDLGREEILLLATDSGNVCAYQVETIFWALERAAEFDLARPLDDSGIHPFFAEFVEESAWGLAIHKFARLIAVSANTGLITVFAFALVNPSSEDGSDPSGSFEASDDQREYEQTWDLITSSDELLRLRNLMPGGHRSRNIRLSYTGHFTNIPCVSFLNCDLDPNGTWMVSTDIDNKMLVWKIWQSLGPFSVSHFNDITSRAFPRSVRNDERGWFVLALDPRAFYPYKSLEEACGGRPTVLEGHNRRVIDLTRLGSRITNVSRLYNYFPPEERIKPRPPSLPDLFSPDCRIDGENNIPPLLKNEARMGISQTSPLHLSDTGFVTQTLGTVGSPSSSMESPEGRDLQGNDMYQDSSGSDVEMIAMETEPFYDQALDSSHENSSISSQGEESFGVQGVPPIHLALLDALGGAPFGPDEFSGSSTGDSHAEHDDEGWEAEGEGSSDENEEEDQDVPSTASFCSEFPILHFSETDIRLIPDPFSTLASVVCGAPLRQLFTHLVTSIHSCDRFNMVKYVPEHGIVVAASQKGRAAIIALTRFGDCMLFRVDWIVPFMNQERHGDRPLRPLLGMTVSPIQGFEMPPDVPYIPQRASDLDDLTFRYKTINRKDEDDSASSVSSITGDGQSPGDADKSHFFNFPDNTTKPWNEKNNPDKGFMHTHSTSTSTPDSKLPRFTLPEYHAGASRIYKPNESWRGWYPSRRYRLLLMYDDHTIMSYEFWYDQNRHDGGVVNEQREGSDCEYLVV